VKWSRVSLDTGENILSRTKIDSSVEKLSHSLALC
jgi:hypothetical protein